MAARLEELPIYPKAIAFCSAVTALLDRPAFGSNRTLHDQIDDANDSILSNMSEGFEQSTDQSVENTPARSLPSRCSPEMANHAALLMAKVCEFVAQSGAGWIISCV